MFSLTSVAKEVVTIRPCKLDCSTWNECCVLKRSTSIPYEIVFFKSSFNICLYLCCEVVTCIFSSNTSLGSQGESIAAQLAQVEDRIRQSVITSPIQGTVLTKYAEAGEYVLPGKALFKVADVGRMKLRAYITADQLTRLKLGQRVQVYADSGEDGRRAYEGTVSWIADRAEFTPKTIQTRDERANLVYAVKVAVRNDGGLKIGMYGGLRF